MQGQDSEGRINPHSRALRPLRERSGSPLIAICMVMRGEVAEARNSEENTMQETCPDVLHDNIRVQNGDGCLSLEGKDSVHLHPAELCYAYVPLGEDVPGCGIIGVYFDSAVDSCTVESSRKGRVRTDFLKKVLSERAMDCSFVSLSIRAIIITAICLDYHIILGVYVVLLYSRTLLSHGTRRVIH
jgi:hypothetical protein